jgi:hypothetical protein
MEAIKEVVVGADVRMVRYFCKAPRTIAIDSLTDTGPAKVVPCAALLNLHFGSAGLEWKCSECGAIDQERTAEWRAKEDAAKAEQEKQRQAEVKRREQGEIADLERKATQAQLEADRLKRLAAEQERLADRFTVEAKARRAGKRPPAPTPPQPADLPAFLRPARL